MEDHADRVTGEVRATPPSDARFRLLVESVRDYAIYMLDPYGHLQSWSAGAKQIMGYEAEEVIGRHFSMLYTPDAAAAGHPERELRVAAAAGRYEEEGWRVRKDGSRFWANVVITAIHDRSGRLVGFAKVARDLSERRQVEEALRRSEERFRLLVDAVSDYAIFALDEEGRVASWNSTAQRIVGYSAEEVAGQHFSVFYTEEDRARDRPRADLERASRDGRFAEEGWRVRRSGERFWASVVITSLLGAEGQHVGYSHVTRDLTERRRAQQALEESEALLTRIVASAMDAIVTTDHERRIVVFNAAAEVLFRIPAAEAIGTLIDRFIPDRFRSEHAEHMRRFGETGVTTRAMNPAAGTLMALRADGTEVPVEAAISQAVVNGQRLFTVLLRDVTHRLRSEEDQHRALREAEAARLAAEEANHSKSQFLATMSHELRTPLNAIIGYERLLEEGITGPVTEAQRRHLGRIYASANHLRGIIDEILTITRIDAGRETLLITDVSAADVIRATAVMLEPQAAEKGLLLRVEPCEPDVNVHTDPGKLRQILLNLLSNAIKFTVEGEVGITAACEFEQVEFLVWDTGVGIPDEHLPRVFERFWQGEQTLTRVHGGTGLGLSVSQRLVELLGGELSVESTPGAGSTFRLRLPLAPT